MTGDILNSTLTFTHGTTDITVYSLQEAILKAYRTVVVAGYKSSIKRQVSDLSVWNKML